MAANNLRIIYQNAADSATITGSSTASSATTTANLKKEAKSLVWRSATSSTTTVKANLVLSGFTSIIGGVILPFCNLTSEATIRVRGYTGNIPTMGGTVDTPTVGTTGSLVFDSGIVAACPYQQLGLWNWGSVPLGVNSYSYGGGTYGRVWISGQLSCTSLLIEIVDTNNANKYIELSKVVMGAYWSPKYNTSYGLSTSLKDLSSHERSEAGDLVTNRGSVYNSMTFDLEWLTVTDRLEFMRILKGNGLPKPILISLFPDNTTDWTKEQAHQIYGKLSQMPGITHSIYDMYSSQIEIEEV